MKICIDAGHGSYTAGKRTDAFTEDIDIDGDGKIDIKKGQTYREHFANVMVANRLSMLLGYYGIDIFKSGWNDSNGSDDADMSITARQRLILKAKCDYVISIHFNASGSAKYNSASGVSVYVRTEKEKRGESDRLAYYLLTELVKGAPQRNRGIGNGKFGMVNATGMGVKAAALVELAFMTNEHEAQNLMANKEFCYECAEELAKGFIDFLTDGIPTKSITPKSSKREVMWLQLMLNKAITSGKVKGDLLVIDGDYGKKTAAVYKAFARYKLWLLPAGWYVGYFGIKALTE